MTEPCAPEHFVYADSQMSRLAQDRCGHCGHVLAVHGSDRVCDICAAVEPVIPLLDAARAWRDSLIPNTSTGLQGPTADLVQAVDAVDGTGS